MNCIAMMSAMLMGLLESGRNFTARFRHMGQVAKKSLAPVTAPIGRSGIPEWPEPQDRGPTGRQTRQSGKFALDNRPALARNSAEPKKPARPGGHPTEVDQCVAKRFIKSIAGGLPNPSATYN